MVYADPICARLHCLICSAAMLFVVAPVAVNNSNTRLYMKLKDRAGVPSTVSIQKPPYMQPLQPHISCGSACCPASSTSGEDSLNKLWLKGGCPVTTLAHTIGYKSVIMNLHECVTPGNAQDMTHMLTL
jgi:hypothetical protein